jgi:hypothetical protein
LSSTIEAATADILRIINSHNTRLRPSFEPDISSHLCSEACYDPPKHQTRVSFSCKPTPIPKRRPISPLVTDLFPDPPSQGIPSPNTIYPYQLPISTVRDPAATANTIAERRARSLSLQSPSPMSRPSLTLGRRSLAVDRPVSGTSRAAAAAARSQSATLDAAAATAASNRNFFRRVVSPQDPERPSSAGAERGGSVASVRSSKTTGPGKPAATVTPLSRRRLWERLRGCFCRARTTK